MKNPPIGKDVDCPECNQATIAIVPRGSEIVETAEKSDGKVWTNCRSCGSRFVVYFLLE